MRRIRAPAAIALPPKISRMVVSAQRRSVTTSGLTDASLIVPGLVGSTSARPVGGATVVAGGVADGVAGVVGVVVAGVAGGGTAARSVAVT